jgi:hypothetical protein
VGAGEVEALALQSIKPIPSDSAWLAQQSGLALATVPFDDPPRRDIGVISGDEHPRQADPSRLGQRQLQQVRPISSSPFRWPHVVTNMAAARCQGLGQFVPETGASDDRSSVADQPEGRLRDPISRQVAASRVIPASFNERSHVASGIAVPVVTFGREFLRHEPTPDQELGDLPVDEAPPCSLRMSASDKVTIISGGRTMQSLADSISSGAGRPVFDKTGLDGYYAYRLEHAGSGTDGPSLFTAIQEQLGLKLEPTRGPVEILAIDRIERPTEN